MHTTHGVIKYFSPAYILQAATAAKEMTLRKSSSLLVCNKKRGNSGHSCENTDHVKHQFKSDISRSKPKFKLRAQT